MKVEFSEQFIEDSIKNSFKRVSHNERLKDFEEKLK